MKGLKTILFFALLASFCSCESFDWFRSESTVRKEITGTWKREFFTTTDVEEDWIFSDGKVAIVTKRNGVNDTIGTGTYTIDTKLTSSHIKLEGFSNSDQLKAYNNKWTIWQLDKEVLGLAADLVGGGGVIQREFEKK